HNSQLTTHRDPWSLPLMYIGVTGATGTALGGSRVLEVLGNKGMAQNHTISLNDNAELYDILIEPPVASLFIFLH
ncbi:hypothetical protein ACJX0J_031975, partial [Zea mays]